MIQKKICLVGAFAVGKTSLVGRYVRSIFSEKYHTTLGVKIDKKVLQASGRDLTFMIWDLAGEDDLMQARISNFRGAAGYILVIDGTRRATLDVAHQIHDRVQKEAGDLPFVAVINKIDLRDEWELEASDSAKLAAQDWKVILGSAKTGEGVEEAFHTLATMILTTS
ncbi:MAG: GTP-binding protein [Planctomycetes bacterium]|nr:GTP-binding protein [Planctomycetota bacterium]